jgi:tRNA uridine 5-carbamoylmethylation protein Kti12
VINQNFLIILIGLPSSGKSTFASKIKLIIEANYPKFRVKIIDPDKIREKIMPSTFDYRKEHIVRKKNLRKVKSGLKKGFIVISDDLNYFSSMRHDLKDIADKLEKDYFLVHIATPIAQCVKWNDERGNPIPNQVIYNIKEKFDFFGDYAWDNPIKVYDLSKNLNLESEIQNLLLNIEKQLKLTKLKGLRIEEKNENIIKYHQALDIETRKVVGKLFTESNFRNIKNDILRIRKLFIKINSETFLKKSEISKNFIDFLEDKLKVDI